MANVIVISAHPDDEVIGAGGTLLKHAANGEKVYWLIITNISEQQGFNKNRVESRQEEISEVAKRMQFADIFKLDYPTMSLHPGNIPDLVNKISDIFNKVMPEYVYVVNRSDAHSDHRIVFESTMPCTKSFRYPFVKKVLMYECISETEFAPALPENVFIPNYFVDISAFMDEKLSVSGLYQSEIGEHPFPRSLVNIKALAQFRGAIAGVEYAEAFQLIKLIDKK
jgi:LmbE family N-acetylglucosaminyl deacetylase